jgi:hypothetical protein
LEDGKPILARNKVPMTPVPNHCKGEIESFGQFVGRAPEGYDLPEIHRLHGLQYAAAEHNIYFGTFYALQNKVDIVPQRL